VELIAVVVILGILMVSGTVSYTSMVERSRRRAAQDLLLAIYYGEQAYQSINRTYYAGSLDAGSSAAAWRAIYMENPNLGSIPITFTVAGDATTFTATATSSAGQSMTVNESRVWCGSSTDPNTCPTWPIP
jgi:Tfp pilus assembly protein PilE